MNPSLNSPCVIGAVKFRTSNGVPGIRVGWVTKKYHMTIMVLDDLLNTDLSYLGFGVSCMSKTENIKDTLTRQEGNGDIANSSQKVNIDITHSLQNV